MIPAEDAADAVTYTAHAAAAVYMCCGGREAARSTILARLSRLSSMASSITVGDQILAKGQCPHAVL